MQGAIQGPKLLFLHGFMGSGCDFEAITTSLGSAFRCLRVDLPGHGQTQVLDPTTGYQFEAIATSLVALLNHLDFTPCHLMGYSMGGRLALYLACQYQSLFSSLLLESASPGLAIVAEQVQRRQQDEQLALQLESEVSWFDFLDQWYSQSVFAELRQHPGFEVLLRSRQHNQPQALAQSLRGMGTGIQPSLWEPLPSLHLPITLLVGALDIKFVEINRAMLQLCPSATLITIPSCGHAVHFENASVVIEALQTHIQSTSTEDITSEFLAQQKLEARKQLLSLDPASAQQQVNQTLYPQHWQHQTQQLTWDESIPTHYGETDA